MSPLLLKDNGGSCMLVEKLARFPSPHFLLEVIQLAENGRKQIETTFYNLLTSKIWFMTQL